MVARFTAKDPEGRTVYWSLADTADHRYPVGAVDDLTAADGADFSRVQHQCYRGTEIQASLPILRCLTGRVITSTNNTYKVAVKASDNPDGAGTNEVPIRKPLIRRLTVRVTDVDETGHCHPLGSAAPSPSVAT